MNPSVFDCGRSLKRNVSGRTPREEPGFPSQNAEFLRIVVDRRTSLVWYLSQHERRIPAASLKAFACSQDTRLFGILSFTPTIINNKYFRLSFPLAILYKHRCSFYLFICLSFAFQKLLKTKHTYLLVQCHRALYVWSVWFVKWITSSIFTSWHLRLQEFHNKTKVATALTGLFQVSEPAWEWESGISCKANVTISLYHVLRILRLWAHYNNSLLHLLDKHWLLSRDLCNILP